MSCMPTFQKPQPGQKFSWEMLYHRCASDFGRAENALACYEREVVALRSALSVANKSLEQARAEAAALRKENGRLSSENVRLMTKLDACAAQVKDLNNKLAACGSLVQSLKADAPVVGYPAPVRAGIPTFPFAVGGIAAVVLYVLWRKK